MIPKRWIASYLRFLLRNRLAVTIVTAVMTIFFAYQCTHIKVLPQFLDFYPGPLKLTILGKEITLREGHPYIKIYNEFRRMFGSANVLTLIIETKHGDIYNPTTLQKIDQATKALVETKGVVPYQILSIAHPKMKSITNAQGAIQIREVFYPTVPKTMEDAQRVKWAVYSTKGIRGIYVSEDDTAALVTAGFWEEELDFDYLYERMNTLKQQLEDDNHTVYISGFPWLYTSIQRYVPEVGQVFVITIAALTFLLWNYFRSWPGAWVPIFSGILSSVWALGLVPLLGLNLDPLVLVIPVFLSARALSHSVQSMDRYHEEYHRSHDKHTAIVQSYSHLFPPAIASVLADGVALLVVAIAPIPLIQKCAIFSSFWIVSIFVSVVTLHPIILSATTPPGVDSKYPRWAKVLGYTVLAVVALFFFGYAIKLTIALIGWIKTALMLAVAFALIAGTRWRTRSSPIDDRGEQRMAALGRRGAHDRALPRVSVLRLAAQGGNMTPGAALLFPNHLQRRLRQAEQKFEGANTLVVIADTGKEGGMKDVRRSPPWKSSATTWSRWRARRLGDDRRHHEAAVATLPRGRAQVGLHPDKQKYIAELFYQFTQTSRPVTSTACSPDFRYGTVITLFHGYSHDIIMNAIDSAKEGPRSTPARTCTSCWRAGSTACWRR